jgi:hypothetical protein
MKTMNELIAQNSLDPVVSEQNRATIMDVGEALRQVVNENFPQLRYPVIAGGAIRDTIFGLPIKDFDIFFDTSVFEDEEREDIALLLIAMVCEKLGEHEYPNLRNCRFGMVGHNDGYAVGEGEDRKVPFVVYENYPYEEPVQEWIPDQNMWNEAEAVPDPRPYAFPMLQVIGHKDDRLRTEPVAFLEYFDYDLVRGLFDPNDMKFAFHPSLEQTILSREISYNNQKTLYRVTDFFNKMYGPRGGPQLAASFKVIDTRPKEVPPVDVPFEDKIGALLRPGDILMRPGDILNIENCQWRIID